MVLHEFLERIDSLNLAVFHPNDAITAAKYPELVGGKDATLILEETKNGIIEDMTANMSVNSAERVVHKNDIGVEVDRSGDIETLLLTSRDGNTTFADFRHIAIGKHIEICLERAARKYVSDN
jgi:hypothetical protein